MTNVFRAVAAALLVLAVGVGTAGSVAAQPSGPLPVLTGHVRLMIAGDSTAAGVPIGCGDGTLFGERLTLGNWLSIAGGRDVKFVGSIVNSCAVPWNRTEGRGGETIRNLADHIGGHLAGNPADILILRVGINDATSWSGWRSAEQMAADYTRLLDNARVARPGIRILAGEIIPPDGMTSADLARASVTARKFNLLLPAIVAPYGDSVHIAEYGRITPARFADGLHPDPYGYSDIAWITMQQPDGLWPWLSADPPPAVRPWNIVLDPWR